LFDSSESALHPEGNSASFAETSHCYVFNVVLAVDLVLPRLQSFMRLILMCGLRSWLHRIFCFLLPVFLCVALVPVVSSANGNVYVSRFWHNHQPTYWPDWNGNGGQNLRVQYAWDSIVLKDSQDYGTGQGHPDNNLGEIFGKNDRVQAYQNTPRDSLANLDQNAGYAISYSGSLIDNINNLGANNQLGYGSGWWNGFREARGWYTPAGSRRMDMVGFTYHHSLAAVLPKSVLRKEIQTFKQVWWKAWGGNSDLSDHSKGFFPTEMAFSTEMVDVLVDEGYEWVIVPSHHLSRTCPTYNDHADPEGSFQIKSSPPNRADQTGPSPTSGWWFAEPNPGNAAWNVSPYAYQLHKTQYINPETGAAKTIVVVPSDDVLSYKAGYSGADVGMISDNISPYANDPNRPVIVLPATDGDNAWGGGASSWFESTPSFFGGCLNAGYHVTAIQDFVNQYKDHADLVHVENGAWIFPESAYGAPYFMKWVEPPVDPDHPELCYTNTMVNIETPGFALKFWSWAAVITGANWCETAEQIMKGEGGSVDSWKIAQPYDNLVNGAWNNPNIVEQAWHIYLAGLDSGFNYYGGLGNDDEVKPSLAVRRAVEKIESYVNARLTSDATGPSIFRPQRFPWNPGGYTFGWFNRVPGVDERYLKKMPSYFYIWSHVYDVSGVDAVNLKVRLDNDGYNSLQSNHNELYAGGADVGAWVTVAMTKKALPNDRTSLNAAADNGQIDYFITPPYLADYYFARIDGTSLPGYKGKLIDYYIEATDSRGNIRKSDIQHVFVEDDGIAEGSSVSFSDDPNDCDPITVSYEPGNGPLNGISSVYMQISFDAAATNWTRYLMTNAAADGFSYALSAPDNAPKATVWFEDFSGSNVDSRGGLNWSADIRDCDAPTGPGSVTFSNAPISEPVILTYHPNAGVLQGEAQIYAHIGFNGWEVVLDDVSLSRIDDNNWQYSIVPIEDSTNLNVVFNNGVSTWDNNSGSNWNFSVSGAAKVVVAPGIIITDPVEESFRFTNSVQSITLRGTAGDAVVSGLSWTNVQAAVGGYLTKTSYWEVASLPLVFGSNSVTVSGSSAGSPTTNAVDDSEQSSYSDGWISGDDGGVGWGGGWNLIGGDNAGLFIATSGANSNLDSCASAFGMYANSGDLAQAVRPLVTPLRTGQTVRVMFENGWIGTSNSVGFALENEDESLFECYFYGGDGTYRVTDSLGNRDTGVAFTDQGLMIEFSLMGETNYTAVIGGTNVSGNLIVRGDTAIKRLRFWNYSAGSGERYNAYFNDLVVTEDSGGGVLRDTVEIYLVDPDNNIPEWWLDKYFGSGTADVAQIDSDGDGHINQHEYWLGTDPTNAASSLVIEGVGLNENGDYVIDWLSVGAHAYDIQYTDDPLTGAVFNTLITVQESAADAGVETNRIFEDTISPANTNGARFYRVKLHM